MIKVAVTVMARVSPEHDGAPRAQRKEDVKWIEENIKKRECSCYMEKTQAEGETEPICFCGYTKSQHSELARRQNGISTDKWTKDTHTETSTTDAFGKIQFDGFGDVSKYIRADVDTDAETIVELMEKRWGLFKPNLLISVTGGAKAFHMKTRLKDAFKRGLMKAASNTGAWIITGGTNTGVMKHVGEAVRDFGLAANNKGQVIAIGIVSWGCVQNKKGLIDKQGKWPASYKISKDPNENESFLDPNHSHFILVDNGTQHEFGVEIPFRAKVEKQIANMKTNTGQDAVTVPICMLVLEGGPGTLQTCSSAIANGTPAVIIKGSGRAANILAYAYQNSKEEEVEVTDKEGRIHKQSQTVIDSALEAEIRKMVKTEFTETNLSQHVGWVRECLKNRDLLTVFELDSRNSASDIDMAILKALLRANKNEIMGRLKLALDFNRIDIAKSDIFTENQKWLPGSLDELMLSAIQKNRPDFVDLFLDYGVNLKDILTPRRLLCLYNNMNQKSVVYSLLSKQKSKDRPLDFTKSKNFNLNDVRLLIKNLIGDCYKPSYPALNASVILSDTTCADVSVMEGLKRVAVMISNTGPAIDPQNIADRTDSIDRPAQELFIWAVLLNRQSLAKLFWREGNEKIAAALVANKLLNALKNYTKDAEQIKSLTEDAGEFENLASGVLNCCYNTDENRAQELLIRELSHWGSTSSILIAYESHNKHFVSQTACQTLITKIWMGEMSHDYHFLRLLTSILLPPLICCLIKFHEKETDKHEAPIKSVADAKTAANKPSDGQFTREPTTDQQDKTTELKNKNKLWRFYTAPVIIFYVNVISFLLFLILFSYILLVQFNRTFSIFEGILIGWVFTLLIEEIREFIKDNATSINSKIDSYFMNMWNVLDIITIFLFTTGMILRFISNDYCFETARVILALNLVSFFMRILHIFSVNKHLGPKLVMIKKMMSDLFYFVVIWMVFILAYAIASESILYPNTPFDLYLLFYTVRKAYWTVYGELFLGELEATNGNGCTNDPLLYADHKELRCPSEVGRYAVPVLMGSYILLTNVLLLNLLIAMFSYTFQLIQDNTDEYWSFQRLRLVVEYHARPALPPPFIIFTHLWLAFKCIYNKCSGPRKNPSTELCKTFEPFEKEQLIEWENVIADMYRNNEEQTEFQSVGHQIKMNRLDSVMAKVDDLQESQSGGLNLSMSRQTGSMKISPHIEHRLVSLENQLKHTLTALNWMMNKMESNPPVLPDLHKEQEKEREEKDKQDADVRWQVQLDRVKRLQLPFKSRQQIYPDSSVYRFSMPDEKVPWKVSFPMYNPVMYTATSIIGKPWADSIDLYKVSLNKRREITLNAYDKKFGVDRKSHMGKYEVKDGIPLNPRGRTGLIGRGLLGRWGPNHRGDSVVTRWKLDGSGNKVMENNKPVLEFVAIQRSDNKLWAIPGSICEPGHSVWDNMKTYFTEEALGSLMDDPAEKKRILAKLETLSKTGINVYEGYADDPRNTDNAWLETQVFSYHDEDGSILVHFNLQAGDDVEVATWQTVSASMGLHGGHSYYLSLVAERLHAAF